MLLRAQPMDRGILAATLALAAAATLALTSGYTQTAGRLLSDAPAAIDGVQAARAPAPAPAPARHRHDAPARATTSTAGDQRGLALYFLIEAARCRCSRASVESMIHRFLAVVILASLLVVPALAAELRLTIKGIRSDDGEILVALYNNPEGYVSALANAATRGLMPDSGRLIGTSIRAIAGSQSTVFTQLPPGRYAILVIHDENDHGRLDEDALGVPTEGYGFGNDAQGFLSAPSFDAAAVTIGKADASTSVTLIYPKVESDVDRSDYNEFTGNSQKKPGQ